MKIRVQLLLSLIGLIANGATAQNTAFSTYQTLPVNGITMAYRDIGKGPALVLLHGFGGTGEAWNPFIEELSADYRLIIPDLRVLLKTGFSILDISGAIFFDHSGCIQV
jgi:cephalosporin-C deacetylase-like acetyl esterase